MDEASCSVRPHLLLLIDTFLGGFPQGGHISAEDCDQEDASRVRRNVDVVPELWCCIPVSCIGANVMQCGIYQLPMEKAPEVLWHSLRASI